MSRFDQQVTFLLVDDLDRSTLFYRDTLGLSLVLDQGDCRIFGVTATAFVGVCERRGRTDRDSVLVTFVTDDVDGVHETLAAAGVPCEKAPQRYDDYDVYHAFYRDPDGFLVEVQRFLDPAWPRVDGND